MPSVAMLRDQFFNLIQDTYGEKSFRGEYDGSGNLIYAATALPGSSESSPVWQLKKLTYSGTNLTSILWPQISSKATRDYSFTWTGRAGYTYS